MGDKEYITYQDFNQNINGCYDLYIKAADRCNTKEEKDIINSFMRQVCSELKKIPVAVFEEIMERGIHTEEEYNCFYSLLAMSASIGWYELTSMITEKNIDQSVKNGMYDALLRTFREEGDFPVPVFDYLPFCNNELDMVAYQKQYFNHEIASVKKMVPDQEKEIMERLAAISRLAETVSEKAQSCEQMKEEIMNRDMNRLTEEMEDLKKEKQEMEDKYMELQEEKEYYQRLYTEEAIKLEKFILNNSELTSLLRKKEYIIQEQQEKLKDFKVENDALKQQLINLAVIEQPENSSLSEAVKEPESNKLENEEKDGISIDNLNFNSENDESLYEPAENEVKYYPLSEEETEDDKIPEAERLKKKRVGFVNGIFTKGKMFKFKQLSENEKLKVIMDYIAEKKEYQEVKQEIMMKLAHTSDYDSIYINLLEGKPFLEEGQIS